MENSNEKVTYTTFEPDVMLSVIFGISASFLIVFASLMLYVAIVILPEEITFAPGRIALAAGTVFVGSFFLIAIAVTGWRFVSYCGLFRTDYIFDTDGIHVKGLFKRQFMPWSQVKDFGFSFVMYKREYRRYSRYSRGKWLVKTGRIYKVYFSDTECKSLPNAQKELQGKLINFYIVFPLSTPTVEHYEGMTWVRDFIEYAENKTGIKAHVPGYVHPFLYPEQTYNTTE